MLQISFNFYSRNIKFPNEKGRDGWTPIQLAAQSGHIDVVKHLAGITDNPNCPGNIGLTPIHLANQKGYPEIVDFLKSDLDRRTLIAKFRRNVLFFVK